jgi:hypothetical protein
LKYWKGPKTGSEVLALMSPSSPKHKTLVPMEEQKTLDTKEEEAVECPICYEPLTKKSDVIVLPHCKHLYCNKCLSRLEDKCAMCRIPIPNNIR